LSSLFPPPARTIAGAIRTLIGETQGVDWQRFVKHDEYQELKQQIGADDDLGLLKITGPYPLWKGERLYPVPLHLLVKAEEYVFLQPGESVKCDLGNVRLPEKPKNALSGAKPLETAWLDGANLQQVLRGQFPQPPCPLRQLYAVEPRLGIARNNAQRTAADGLLYQTRHLRPRAELSIGVTLNGILPELQPDNGVIRFGGEGRASAVSITDSLLFLPPLTGSTQQLLLMLLTPADFNGDWLLPDFTVDSQDGIRIWRGEINGVSLILHSAVLGKTTREGGWDLLNQRPRPVQSLVPAGSVYFCTVEGDSGTAIKALHGHHLGHDTALGRGELAVGFWQF
jgi:CRISPR-associated protein Cmr3